MADFFGGLTDFLKTTPSNQVGGAIGNLGGAVSDYFGAVGAQRTADEFSAEKRADLTRAELAKQTTDLQEYSASRKIEATKGAAIASTAAAGFQESGSGLELLRESTQQGYLTQAVIGEQGAVSEGGYMDAAARAQEQEDAAHGAVFGNIIGGVLKAGAAAAQLAAI